MPVNEMPSWAEWNEQLSEEQRKYSLYKTLESINSQLAERDKSCVARETICIAHFQKLDRRKKWNSAESMLGGIIGGILAVIGGWAFWMGLVP